MKKPVMSPPLFLLLLLFLGFFFASYNLLTIVVRYRSGEASLDPVVGMPEARRMAGLSVERLPFHVALTATDSPYSRWQCRIMYYWYKQVRGMPGSEMGGFTRILHSGSEDGLMDEIPTVVVDPLPAGLDRGYVVLNRPWAFVQWLEKATIEEDYILMAEPDHIFVKPLPNLARGGFPAAFPFFYIKPTENMKIIRKYYPKEKGNVTDIDPIGNSPVIIKKFELEKIAPTWMNVSLKMKDDPETDKAFGWVLEMYAYAVASALHKVQHVLRKDFMIQPPWDSNVGNSFIIHFTYGCDYNMKGKLTYGNIGEWRFDKRSYLRGPPPRNLTLPPPGVPESVLGAGERISFGEDTWLGEGPLRERFPLIFRIAVEVEAPVHHFWQGRGDTGYWEVQVRRNLNDNEVDGYLSLLEELHGARVVATRQDRIIWKSKPVEGFFR